ncbi:MAG: hypothetical protein AAF733_08065, partial [Verrucomicrobiota bacterium]
MAFVQISNEKDQTSGHSQADGDSALQIEEEIIDYFVSFVQMLGLPKSVGQIYGTLFASPEPLVMDDIVERLGISKGSASQGLSLLRSL